MHTSKFKNIYNKKRTDVKWANYKKQQNFCMTLLQRTKKEYFQNLNKCKRFIRQQKILEKN